MTIIKGRSNWVFFLQNTICSFSFFVNCKKNNVIAVKTEQNTPMHTDLNVNHNEHDTTETTNHHRIVVNDDIELPSLISNDAAFGKRRLHHLY
jgi:hypothetical protein